MVSMLRIGSRFLLSAAALLALVGSTAPLVRAAASNRVLDPRLSLIGGCLESGEVDTLDPVEDPGCPTTPPPAEHPPSGVFANPSAVATDVHGDIFVASRGKKADGSEGRIDIFSPAGTFIYEIPAGAVAGPRALAVDSKGVLYVWSANPGELSTFDLFRFEPCGSYDPAAGQIKYCDPPTAVPLTGPECSNFHEAIFCNRTGGELVGLAVDRSDDHPFIHFGSFFVEYGSAEEENEEIRTNLGPEITPTGFVSGLALDSIRHRLYVQEGTDKIGVYELAEGLPPQEEYAQIETIEAATSGVPGGQFGAFPTLAVDEGTGDLFVYNTENSHLWELNEHGQYLSTVDFPLQAGSGGFGTEIAVDNGLSSPNGKLSEEEGKGRYLYVPSNPKGTGHSFAFFVSNTGPPEVKTIAAANISVDEAGLHAQIDSNNLQTTYAFDVKPEGAV